MRLRQIIPAAAMLVLTAFPLSSFASNLQLELKRNPIPRIIGGTELTTGQQPWLVSLQENGEHFCGGSLIDAVWVLTAAHCVEGSASGLQVRANFVDLTDSSEGQRANVSSVFVHPDYLNGDAADIALLKLASPISGVTTLPLADISFMNSSAKPGTTATVSGWGVTRENGDIPNIVQAVDVPLVSTPQCNQPQAYDGQIADTEICAGYQRGGRDSCQGDSGGPLVVHQQGQPVQVGVVSWGDGCALPNKYGVYARVASFNSWISGVRDGSSSTMTGESPSQPSQSGDTPVSGIPFGPLSAAQGETLFFEIPVADSSKVLWVDIRSGTGDADLMLSHGRRPDWDNVDYAPYLDGNNEHVLVEEPQPGTWYIGIDAYDDFDQLELMVFVR